MEEEKYIKVIYSDYSPDIFGLRPDKLYMFKKSTWNAESDRWEYLFFETGW